MAPQIRNTNDPGYCACCNSRFHEHINARLSELNDPSLSTRGGSLRDIMRAFADDLGDFDDPAARESMLRHCSMHLRI